MLPQPDFRLAGVFILETDKVQMKKLLILILLLVVAHQVSFAQNATDKLNVFRSGVLPSYSVYFASAHLTPDNQLELIATADYSLLSANGKKTMMDNLLRSWHETLVIVKFESKRELWGSEADTHKALLLESWDINAAAPVQASQANPSPASKTSMHPWFFYLGGSEMIDSNKNINVAFSSSVGFFLLKNRWDLAATFSGSMMGNFGSESDMAGQTSIGLQSKVYFAIEKYHISPNVGFEIARARYSISETVSKSFTPALVTGISWYVGIGSLDLGFRIGEQSMVMIGYTFVPRIKSK